MPRKRHTIEQIIAILRSAEVEIGNGMTVEEFSRKKDITVQTYYRWRKEYGGVPADQLKRMKQRSESVSSLWPVNMAATATGSFGR